VDFIDALTKQFFLASSNSCVLCIGSMLAFIAFWVIDGIVAEFYFTWFAQAKANVKGQGAPNQSIAFINMQMLIIVVMVVTFIQGILRLLLCKQLPEKESDLDTEE
jgi:hypothetical protein